MLASQSDVIFLYTKDGLSQPIQVINRKFVGGAIDPYPRLESVEQIAPYPFSVNSSGYEVGHYLLPRADRKGAPKGTHTAQPKKKLQGRRETVVIRDEDSEN